MIRTVVVDDEEHARRGIVNRLAKFGDIEIVDISRNGREAIDAIQRCAPALVFLDVQMPGKTGFDVIETIGPTHFPLVIFVTAYDSYAVRAFEVHALDYLLKPIDDERFDAAIARARVTLARDDDAQFRRRLSSLMEESKNPSHRDGDRQQPDRLLVRSGSRTVFVTIDEIDWVAAAGDYVTLHVGKQSLLMHDTISAVERQLRPRGFSRIHRSTLVNRARIAEMHYLDSGDYRVVLKDGTALKLSRNYHSALQELLRPKNK